MFPFPGTFPGPMGPVPPMGHMGPMPSMVPGQYPGPMGFQYPPNDLFGSTSYKYTTPDGRPPLDGKVPTKPPAFGSMVPCMSGAPFSFGPPPAPGWSVPPPPCGGPPPYCAPAPCCVATPAPLPTVPVAWKTPAPPPPPPPGHSFGSTCEAPEPPVKGNRVKGQLATFPNRSVGYIFPKRNVVLHLFSENLVHKYQNKFNLHSHHIKFPLDSEKYNAQIVPLDMTFEELIDQLDCRTRANYYPPYNKPGQGYPEHLIGIQELCRTDGDKWELGTKIVLGEYNAKRKLGDLWSDTDGSTGGSEPRYIVRLPC